MNGFERRDDRPPDAPEPGAPKEGVEFPEAAPEAAPQAEAAPPVEESLEDLRQRAAERDEYLDLLKRARADLANYRKRVEEDRKKWGAIAQRDLLARLMSATDHCRLSAEKSKDDHSVESLRDCIGLIWTELEKFLESSGVRFVPARGEAFDPHKHEAVFVQERADLPDATIIDEIRPGYEFGGQVIRPAQVVVSKAPRPPAAAEGTPAESPAAQDETCNGAEDADG